MDLLCPSSKCEDGAKLLGIVKEDAHVDFLKHPIQIDQDFVDSAKEGRTPELRFRFAGKCLKAGCRQWTGERCGVIDNIVDQLQQAIPEASLPTCSIRPECRWFHQRGPEACKVCPFVITDVTDLQKHEQSFNQSIVSNPK